MTTVLVLFIADVFDVVHVSLRQDLELMQVDVLAQHDFFMQKYKSSFCQNTYSCCGTAAKICL